MTDSIDQDIEDKNFIETIDKIHKELNEGSKPLTEIRKILEPFYQQSKTTEKNEKTVEEQLLADLERCSKRFYDTVIKEHKQHIAEGGLLTGYKCIDEELTIQKTDLFAIQGMSNHGKSSAMLNIEYNLLTLPQNLDKNAIVVHIGYESSLLRTEEKFINIISYNLNKKLAIKFDRHTNSSLLDPQHRQGNYLYISNEANQKAIKAYNELITNERLIIAQKHSLEKISTLIDMLKSRHPDRTIILALDYLQIIPNNIKMEGWEKIKEIAYFLENLAIEKEIIIMIGSQVNEKRETREGKDIYNAATCVLDIFNHSHEMLRDHPDYKNKFREKEDKKNVITIECRKNKFGNLFTASERLLFNGYVFEEKATPVKYN